MELVSFSSDDKNIKVKWISKFTPKFPELLKFRKHDRVEIRYKYYSDDVSYW